VPLFVRKLIVARDRVQAVSWWLAAVGALIAMAAWTQAGAGSIPFLDREGLALAHAWRSPLLDAAFQALTWLGSMMVLLPLVLAGGVVLWRIGFRGEARFLLVALVGASTFAQLAKHLVPRPRPELFAALAPVASPLSFPSSHAVQVTAVAVASWMIVVRLSPHWRGWVMFPLALVVGLVGFSRLYLQLHYPSDVLAGTLAATFWVAGLRAFMFAGDEVARRE
jgi:membrane-associated phospholipid phosphatase